MDKELQYLDGEYDGWAFPVVVNANKLRWTQKYVELSAHAYRLVLELDHEVVRGDYELHLQELRRYFHKIVDWDIGLGHEDVLVESMVKKGW